MSHTKQTPILQYTTADLPLTPLSGTVVYNTDENCLNYYNGTEWVASDDWESTYTTVGSNSAVWNSAPSVFDADAAVYVSSNGSDLYDGRSMDKPKDTISDAISVAEDLITTGVTGVRIEVLDGSSYGSTSDVISVQDKMHLYAPKATYTGKINIHGGSSVTLDKHFSPLGTPAQALVTVGVGACYYKSNLISSGDNLTSILIFQNTITNLYLDVKNMFVKGTGGPAGLQVVKGKVFLNIGSITLEGTTSSANVYGIYAGSSNPATNTDNYTTGYIGSIKDNSSNISTSNKGVFVTKSNTEVYLRVGEIDTSIPYLISNQGNLFIDCLNINGTPQGAPELEISNLTYNNSNWDSTYTTVGSNSAAWGAGITEVFEDKTPELGGNLQVTGGRTIIDQWGNELVKFEVQNSAGTSYIGIRNGNALGPSLKALGDDANLDLNLQPKGTGSVKITASGGLNLNTYNIKSLGSNILKPIANGNESHIYIMAHGGTGQPGFNPEIGVVSVNTNQGLTLKAKGTGNIKLGTLEFDTDQSVSSSNNDHVLSYSSTDGFISLKPVPGFNNTTVTTASYTQIAGTSHFLYDDSTAGQAITATVLPVGSHNGETTHMKIGGTATVILSSNTTATINGAQSYTLNTTYEAVKMFTDGVNYFVY